MLPARIPKPRKRSSRWRSPSHCTFVRSHECCVPNCDGRPIEVAHIRKGSGAGMGQKPDDWKAILMNACGWDVQFLEGLDGRPFPIGFRSSHMTVKQMIDLIEYMQAFGDENGVIWKQQLQYD